MYYTRKGFTLIELMVVLAILSVLIAIMVPIYMHLVEKPTQTACQSNQRVLESLLVQYKMKHGDFPADLQSLVSDNLIHEIPPCPAEGERYEGTVTLLADGQVTCSGGTRLYPHALH